MSSGYVVWVSASCAPPETKGEKALRLAKEQRIEELLGELKRLGWEPPQFHHYYDYRDDYR